MLIYYNVWVVWETYQLPCCNLLSVSEADKCRLVWCCMYVHLYC